MDIEELHFWLIKMLVNLFLLQFEKIWKLLLQTRKQKNTKDKFIDLQVVVPEFEGFSFPIFDCGDVE